MMLLIATVVGEMACFSSQASDRAVLDSLGEVTTEQWQALSRATIYFGHQSVGANILDGIASIEHRSPRAELRIVPLSGALRERQGLIEFRIGENGSPSSKNAAFARAVDQHASPGSIALFKYCFVDVGPDTDVAKLFEEYRETIESLQSRHSEVTFVAVTMPLTQEESSSKAWAKRLLGRPGDLNVKRNQFNAMVVTHFRGKLPIFDLARFESTRSDGSRVYSNMNGQQIYSLAPDYAEDDGHLNPNGRKHVAEQLLIFLAKLAREVQG